MKFIVDVTATAKQEAEAAYTWLAEKTPLHAPEWFNGLVSAAEGLAFLPKRHSLAAESAEYGETIRELLYGRIPHTFRVLFIIRKNTVHVLHSRHGARRAIPSNQIVFPDDN